MKYSWLGMILFSLHRSPWCHTLSNACCISRNTATQIFLFSKPSLIVLTILWHWVWVQLRARSLPGHEYVALTAACLRLGCRWGSLNVISIHGRLARATYALNLSLHNHCFLAVKLKLIISSFLPVFFISIFLHSSLSLSPSGSLQLFLQFSVSLMYRDYGTVYVSMCYVRVYVYICT
jgi:hypothetical protein